MAKKIIIQCRLKSLLEERGWSPEKLSDLSGVSRPTIYDLRANRISPRLDTLERLANALKITHVELLETREAK